MKATRMISVSAAKSSKGICAKRAEKYEAYSNLLADGHLDGSATIEFAQRIAGTLFGKRVISTVATIASVAPDRAITPVAAREWCL
jgi:hypothetical protein